MNKPSLRAVIFSAGIGSRLKPLTNIWPKCLMPIGKRPLLEYWIEILRMNNFHNILINLHHHKEIILDFLNQERFSFIKKAYEEKLLGTAGTLRANYSFFQDSVTLAIHGDNWCVCNLEDFIDFHFHRRPKNTLISMMIFETETPKTCGIVELDNQGVVIDFYQKNNNPPSNLANAAVFILEPEVIEWIMKEKNVFDISDDVIPQFLGRIATWKNDNIHRDIGNFESLKKAQNDSKPILKDSGDHWQKNFLEHKIHTLIKEI